MGALLKRLAARGVEVRVDGGRLRVEAARGILDGKALAWLSSHRGEILAEILPADDLDTWQERAAIMEFDGGLDRDTAERGALADLEGLADSAWAGGGSGPRGGIEPAQRQGFAEK